MDYEKKYKNALEWARQVMTGETGFIRKEVEEIFPELKESEDEKIRKRLIFDFKVLGKTEWGGLEVKDIIAWLEKQKDIDVLDEEEREFADNVDSYRKEIDEAYQKGYNEGVKATLEKQGEQKPIDFSDLRTWKYIVDAVWTEKEGIGQYIDSPFTEEVAKKLQKRFGNIKPKPTDKVEPKFKVGDWVIDKQGIAHQIANVIENVTYHTYGYDIVGGGYFNDNTEGVRLWTIEDAKDGDILSDGTTIFIFKDLLSDGSVMSYCDYDTDSGESDAFCPLSVNLMCSKITPATKEQRDTLMKAMGDARYTFDFKKKELKKIEQKPAELFENRSKELSLSLQIQAYLSTASDELYAKGKPLYSEKRIEDIHKCMLMWEKLHNAYFYRKSAWSEEDEGILQSIILCLENLMDNSPTGCFNDFNKCINWLKSLSPQNR